MAEQLHTHRGLWLARLAAKQWGVVTVGDMRACGFSKDAVAGLVARGLLHRVHRGVYALGHPGLGLEGRFLAATRACGPWAALSHYSGAALFEMADWDDRPIEVTVCGTVRRTHAGLNVHRTRWLERRDIRVYRGIPVTSPARVCLDLAASMPPRALRHLVRQAQGRGRVSVEQLASLLTRAGRRPGAPALAAIVASGPAPTRSVRENVVLDLILGGGLRHPDVNRPLWLDGRKVVPDFRWPERRLVVEADSAAWHDGKVASEDDAERQALLEEHGERVVRVTWDQALKRPAQTLARIIAAGAPVSA